VEGQLALKLKPTKREAAHLKTYLTAKDRALRDQERAQHNTLWSMMKEKSKNLVILISGTLKKTLALIREKQMLSKKSFSQSLKQLSPAGKCLRK
jgi:vacuolar-type H+-ATPase subunit E/Vma4